jgi:hypothetical protein
MYHLRHDRKSHKEELDEVSHRKLLGDNWASGESALCYYQNKEGKYDRSHYSHSQ